MAGAKSFDASQAAHHQQARAHASDGSRDHSLHRAGRRRANERHRKRRMQYERRASISFHPSSRLFAPPSLKEAPISATPVRRARQRLAGKIQIPEGKRPDRLFAARQQSGAAHTLPTNGALSRAHPQPVLKSFALLEQPRFLCCASFWRTGHAASRALLDLSPPPPQPSRYDLVCQDHRRDDAVTR